jgi:hypothetical protein
MRRQTGRINRLKRFHHLRALSRIVQGGFPLREVPLSSRGFWVRQLWNRCSVHYCTGASSLRVIGVRAPCLSFDHVR